MPKAAASVRAATWSASARTSTATRPRRDPSSSTTIGICPDVGGGRYLSRLRGRLAQFLALTGARLDGAESLRLRLATHYLPSDRLEEAQERIMAQPLRVQA